MVRTFFLVVVFALTAAAASRLDDAGKEWWKNVAFLASDDLQGRNVGTQGFDLAANFVAEQYRRLGLAAVGEDGYFQRIALSESTLTWAAVRLKRHGKVDAVSIPLEVLPNFNAQLAKEVTAPVVFAGYGLKIPEADYDDLKGLPIKGAIVAYMMGGPADVPGNLRSHYSSTEMRWRAMEEAGAIGMIAIPDPRTMEISWARQASAISSPRMELNDPQMNRFKGLQFSAEWNPAMADDLLEGSGHQFLQVLDADSNRRPLPHFVVGCTLRSNMSVSQRTITSKNVVAVRPGTDEDLKDEYVVVSSHLDHLGASNDTSHGSHVYHGAMDDASGVASTIEIAKLLQKVSTKRSLLFVALTGEEKGELGSAYLAQYPPVSGRIVADLNMDMFLPLVPLKWLEVQGVDESTLGGDIRIVAEQAGIKVQSDREPGKNRFIRSDQYSFVKAGVPALAFKFGYRKGDPEEKVFQRWYATRYHGVKDDSTQPVDLEAAAKFNELLKTLLVRVADADAAPKWLEGSFFRRFAQAAGM